MYDAICFVVLERFSGWIERNCDRASTACALGADWDGGCITCSMS